MTPEKAYNYAYKHGPSEEIREIVCKDSQWAYNYALMYGPSEEIREIVCKDSQYAYKYAGNVDKRPRDDTRKAACADSEYAYLYALYVDKCPREDTREAACKNSRWAFRYASDILPRMNSWGSPSPNGLGNLDWNYISNQSAVSDCQLRPAVIGFANHIQTILF